MASTTLTETQFRSELGDFSSIVCFKALISGLEEALGEKAAYISVVAAGRLRGKTLVTELGLAGQKPDLAAAAIAMNQALGKEGTRLCIVDKIEAFDDGYRVYCRETVCSAGEPQGASTTLSFTLGAIQGALETMMEKRLRGTQVESVLRGSQHDIVELNFR
ncbi:hypothetical protein [Nodosilinea sp. E11]|uniref:hypothetical protein n=1 Tax=Nodosilinea sp. E11 TaxID=3037479 RepID=UPI0029344247|nr:hypothetical protein [Nodosilinea sp. E11]WOD38136.1 hypothetical protein RRF56_18145 [Nodosilinea sp. E11]